MKPFDIEAAKRGEPVVTRDGRRVRIFTFDADNRSPISGVVASNGREEHVQWMIDGKHYCYNLYDLFMAPRKIEYWENVFSYAVGGGVYTCGCYKSENEALENRYNGGKTGYLKTIKIHEEEI